jgi:hypothetical protein
MISGTNRTVICLAWSDLERKLCAIVDKVGPSILNGHAIQNLHALGSALLGGQTL